MDKYRYTKAANFTYWAKTCEGDLYKKPIYSLTKTFSIFYLIKHQQLFYICVMFHIHEAIFTRILWYIHCLLPWFLHNVLLNRENTPGHDIYEPWSKDNMCGWTTLQILVYSRDTIALKGNIGDQVLILYWLKSNAIWWPLHVMLFHVYQDHVYVCECII